MKIRSAELLHSAFNPGQLPPLRFPEVAVFGRSNVGKSSLLGALLGRKGMARVSSTPGKTQGIFFYIVNGELVLADLPGYGFSRAPREVKALWRPLVEAYLDRGPALALHLVDIRHSPSEDDCDVHRMLSGRGVPTLTVATKSDKLTRGAAASALPDLARSLAEPPDSIVSFSVHQGGRPAQELWDRIRGALARPR